MTEDGPVSRDTRVDQATHVMTQMTYIIQHLPKGFPEILDFLEISPLNFSDIDQKIEKQVWVGQGVKSGSYKDYLNPKNIFSKPFVKKESREQIVRGFGRRNGTFAGKQASHSGL